MIVFCTACTCKFNENGKCAKEFINLEDFEYFKDSKNKEKDYLSDDMKCVSYESKNKR